MFWEILSERAVLATSESVDDADRRLYELDLGNDTIHHVQVGEEHEASTVHCLGNHQDSHPSEDRWHSGHLL